MNIQNLIQASMKLLLSLLFSLFILKASAQYAEPNILEQQVQEAVKKAMPASVYITDYDPINKGIAKSRFSGVVVSSDGIILTVAHTTMPNGNYRITFPDGRQCTAVGLGMIAGVDGAMLKINEQGPWPFAEMGWSSSLKENEPCIGISYPASFESNIMLVRFGHIAEQSTVLRANRIRTTLLMEPGDSGGPAFDLFGRVIGMHSSIDSALTNNFEVPVDQFRKYWHALEQPIAYEVLPMGEGVSSDTISSKKHAFNDLNDFRTGFSKLEIQLNKSVLNITSNLNHKAITINGTLISLKGILPTKQISGKSYLISKNSMVGENPLVDMGNGKIVSARIVVRDDPKDLILLEVPTVTKTAITLNVLPSGVLDNNDLGKFLFSPQAGTGGIWSVLGTTRFDLPKRFRAGYSGAYPIMKDGKVVLGIVAEDSAAKLAKLKAGDEVQRINGILIDSPNSFMREMRKTLPGDEVDLVRSSAGAIDTEKIKMLKYPVFGNMHPAEIFSGGKSNYRDGYDGVFVHDGKLRPSQCGGPIFDIRGHFLGMNIARFSRTSCIVITANELTDFIVKLK